MATLTNTKIKDTYDGLLKTTDNEALDVSGVTLIEDGLGNASALSVGRSGNGVSVSGLLDVSGEVQGTSLDINGAADISGNLAVDTNTLYVDAANNRVGIGTSSPSTLLHLAGDQTAIVRVENNTALGLNELIGGYEFYKADGTAPGAGVVGGVRMYSGDSSGGSSYMTLSTTGSSLDTERMRIDSSGNVGIGRTPYSAFGFTTLDIDGTNGSLFLLRTNGTTHFSIGTSSGNPTVKAEGGKDLLFDTNAAERMRIDSSGNVGIGGSAGNGYRLELSGSSEAANTLGMTYIGVGAAAVKVNSSGALEFGLDGADGSTERMRITSGGDVLIDATSASLSNGTTLYEGGGIATTRSNATVVSINRQTSFGTAVQFYQNNDPVGSISVTSTATAYNTSSDYRLKENVVEMTGALDRVDALKPSRFNFIADPEKTVDGFIAHEVQAIVPEAVTGEKDAVDEEGNPIYQGIDQSKIVPLLVGAIKELRAEIETLKSQLNA